MRHILRPIFKAKPKIRGGEPEDPHFNPFLLMLVFAGVGLICLLLYVLLYPVFFGDGEPEYEIVPYSSPTSVVQVATMTPFQAPTTAPSPTPAPTSTTPLPITAATVGGLAVSTQFSGLSAGVSSLAYSPDGTRLAAGSLDGSVRVWDTRTLSLLYTFTNASNRVNDLAYSPDGTRLVAGGQDNLVRWWDVTTGIEIGPLNGPTGSVNAVAFGPTGLIAAGSDDGHVYIWDVTANPDDVAQKLSGHTSFVTSVAFSPDGSRIAAGSADRAIRVWNVADGTLALAMSGHSSNITSVTYSPDGTRLVSTSHDHTARLWDVSASSPLAGDAVAILDEHTENVNAAAFTPDGLLLATGSGGINDDRIIVWDTRTAAALHALPSPGGAVNAVLFSPDGTRLATGGATFVALWTTTHAATPQAPQVQVSDDPGLAIPTAGPLPSATVAVTFAPVPTVNAGAAQADACILTVRVEQGNVRALPDETAAPAGALTLNQTVQATGWTQSVDGFTWWRLANGAWARGDLFVTVAQPDLPEPCWSQPLVDPYAAPEQTSAPGQTLPTATVPANALTCTLTGLVPDINLRAGPDLSYEKVGTLNTGVQVQATGWTQGANGYTWWRLSGGAWVRADVVQFEAACQSLPHVSVQ